MEGKSPVALFVYSRPAHTKATLEALSSNHEANKTDLWVFSDDARGPADREHVMKVREIIREAQGFRTINLVERNGNWGLAANIIDGVSRVCRIYGTVVVVEDDIVTSPNFLRFMNERLRHYESDMRVWHISGWSYPLRKTRGTDCFFWRTMNCWGWATWWNRWQHFQRNPDDLVRRWSNEEIVRFDLDGYYPFWNQVLRNRAGALDSWAVFWYATIFERGGLCLNPVETLVANIGLDGTGENSKDELMSVIQPSEELPTSLPDPSQEDSEMVDAIKVHLDSKRGIRGRGIRGVLGKAWRSLCSG